MASIMKKYRSEIIISLFLVIITLAVFWKVRTHDFVNFDDNIYVTENPFVTSGWTAEGLIWAFTTILDGHWHPLTWLSHMTDCALFGLNPGCHHMTSLILHLLNVLLLFSVLRFMTGAVLRSAVVAALFAIHPLHVEPVAWVASRKDVLSALFWMLTMWTYAFYCRRPAISKYILVLFFFAAGIMSKSMVVTLPVVFFLMDYWPLNRVRQGSTDGKKDLEKSKFPSSGFKRFSLPRLIAEKLLLFILLGVSAILAVSAMLSVQAFTMRLSSIMPEWDNIVRVPLSYLSYIGKMFWPYKLAVTYPYPEVIPSWQAAGAAVLFIFISVLAIFQARKRPYFIVGWLWYIVTLIPVIRLFNIGPQIIADRYTYIPLIGLFIIIAWGVPDLLARLRYRTVVLCISTTMMLIWLSISSFVQAGYWENSLSLFGRAIKVTNDNWLAHYNLGSFLLRKGNFKEAANHFSETIRIRPGNEDAHNNLGNAFAKLGRPDDAVRHYLEALNIKPADAEFHNNLAIALDMQGNAEEATRHYSEALRIKPGLAKVHNNLGNALKRQARLEEAIRHLFKAVQIDPVNAEYHKDLGIGLARQGKIKEAISHFSEAVKIEPLNAEFHNNLAIALDMQGNAKEAIRHYSEALRIRPDYVRAHYNLGSTFRRQGRIDDAVRHLKEAVRLKPADAEFHNTLGIALAQRRDFKGAISHFSEAAKIRPGYRKALENLEFVLRLINKGSRNPNVLKKP